MNNENSLPQVSWSEITYDQIIEDNVKVYMETHPDTEFNEAFDIVRAKSDRDYL